MKKLDFPQKNSAFLNKNWAHRRPGASHNLPEIAQRKPWHKAYTSDCTYYCQFKVERDEIVDWHNKLRGKIANGSEPAWGLGRPRAANMNKLVWSEELARIAQVNESSGKLVVAFFYWYAVLFCRGGPINACQDMTRTEKAPIWESVRPNSSTPIFVRTSHRSSTVGYADERPSLEPRFCSQAKTLEQNGPGKR